MNAFVRTGGIFSVLPLVAVASYGMTTSAIGLAMVLGSFAGLIAAYPAGALSDRFGRKAIIVPATILTGATMLLFAYAPNALWFAAAFVLWGTMTSIGGAAPAAYAADAAPKGMNAAALSTFRMTGDAGYVLGPLLIGVMVDIYGTTIALFVSAAMIVAAGAAFALWAPETHKARKS